MAACVTVNELNQVVLDANQDTTLCAEFVLLSPGEYSGLSFMDIFDPSYLTTEQLQGLFMLGISTPIIAYLSAWAYQTVINFATKDKE